MEPIGLKEAIEVLRKELSESILAAADEELRFKVGQITVEMQLAVERKAEGKAGIKFWVLELGGQGSHGTTETHKVTIPLTPIGSDGNPVLTGRDAVRE
jgi:Trypsin-co-occurring domain 2